MKTKTNILLVSVNQQKSPYPVYPIGLSYLATYLRSEINTVDVSICDFNISDINGCMMQIREYKPDFVGVSLRNVDDVNFFNKTNYIHSYKQLIDTIRQETKAVIVLGGAGFSIFPQKLYDFLQPDFAIKGEGEQAFLSLIEAIKSDMEYKHIDGLVYKENNTVIINDYTSKRESYAFYLDFEHSLIDYYWKYSGMFNIQTKRGCPNTCIYCTYPVIEGCNVRTQDIDTVVGSMEKMNKSHNINYFFFTDSLFNLRNDYNYAFSEALIKKNLNIQWGGYFSPDNLPRDLLVLLKKAGLTHIEFGTESLSDTTLQAYQKGFTFADVVSASRLCNELDIYYAHFLILAGYGETEKTIDETFLHCQSIDNSVFFPFVGMRIYPQTTLYNIAVQEQVIDENTNLLEPVYYISPDVNIKRLKEKAALTGKSWIFPDIDHTESLMKMRLRNKKGPLWEYLIK